jgi:hypothetical protein
MQREAEKMLKKAGGKMVKAGSKHLIYRLGTRTIALSRAPVCKSWELDKVRALIRSQQ